MKDNRKKKGKPIGLKAFIAYLEGRLSGNERHRFERSVMSDPFVADAYDGFLQLSANELRHDMHALNKRLESKKNNKKLWLWMGAVASVTIVAGLFSLLFLIIPHSPNEQLATLKPSDDTLYVKEAIIPEMAGQKATDSLPAKPSLAAIPKPVVTDIIIIDDNFVTDSDLDYEPSAPLAIVSSGGEHTTEGTTQKRTPTISGNAVNLAEMPERSSNIRIRGISSKNITPPQDTSVEKMLQGKVSGVKISMDKMDTGALIVKGYVMDDNRHPLPGASIVHNKSKKATITNINGYFEIAIPTDEKENDKLTASFIGFDNFEFDARKDTTKIILNPNLLALEEVVVVGYGVQKEETQNYEYIQSKPRMGYSAYRKKVLDQIKSLNLPGNSENRLIVKITISSFGEVELVEIIRSPYEPLNDEITRIIQQADQWEPARKNNSPVKETQRLSYRIK